jgi:hypothetical protein
VRPHRLARRAEPAAYRGGTVLVPGVRMKVATVGLVALILAGSVPAGRLWAQRATNPTVLSGDNVGVEVVTQPDKDGLVGVRYMVKLNGTGFETHPAPQVIRLGSPTGRQAATSQGRNREPGASS